MDVYKLCVITIYNFAPLLAPNRAKMLTIGCSLTNLNAHIYPSE